MFTNAENQIRPQKLGSAARAPPNPAHQSVKYPVLAVVAAGVVYMFWAFLEEGASPE